MIKKDNFKKVLKNLEFIEKDNIFTKKFGDFELKADFKNEKLIFPDSLIVNDKTTSNFTSPENFVVFECVHKLLSQGYNPKHIELEPKWQVGHGASGGKADILVKDNDDKALLIIECKTAGKEFEKAWETAQTKPTQIFSYAQQDRNTKFIALYASDFLDNKVVSNYYIITLSDDTQILHLNKKLKSYSNASTTNEIYDVWVNTYDKQAEKKGIFESNKPYFIGVEKSISKDLQNITSKDIQGKYHEFATILRQHNVSGRENAFDKLVNLFLCKVTDEKENPNDLKFYYKGKAYDNPFDFQDRLQQLYKIGMDKFLDDKITYIENNLIDEAFGVFKDKPNETKRLVKEYLKQQKFFTNNDFAFIDVHNEKLFYQNFEVLLKISNMIQDISLTGSDENQFLGDMFEGFLDQGVKQSEGQFFTPMPIVKFIINSLPNKKTPKVIDYACGAGHFLNEYFVSNNQSKIVGIEKEYRLSKVAKVSSFMYGSDMDIVYSDALASNNKIKDNEYDVLIANPPYSVKGFLETLSQEDREKYDLIDTIDKKSYRANNAIECFFIERSKQLLTKDAVAGIVVPSSILNKGSQNINANKRNVYVGTREIILKYFDIVAIAEFGSGTFGKTGTNTVTLFLKRRGSNPDISNHIQNMVNSWFENDLDINKVFEDDFLLEKYCSYIDMKLDIYNSLLSKELDDEIFTQDTFKEYKVEFEKLTETKKRKTQKYYKALSEEQKEEKEKEYLVNYIRDIEKDKLYYFCLAYKNSTDVVIVKSPSKNNDNKKFLGYEWSSAKGNEGIQYLTSSIKIDDDSLDEDDKRVLENLQGLKHINTPLYNPNNIEDSSKINKIIKDNFDGIKTKIPADLEKYVSRVKVTDMLDFSRVDFNKALSLSPSKKVEIESKYPLEKIEKIITKLINGSTPSKNETNYWNSEDINWLTTPDFNDENIYINSTSQFVSKKALKDKKVTVVPKNSVVITCTATIGKVGVLKIDLTTNQQINALVCDNKKVISEYLAYFMLTQKENLENLTSNSGVKHINMGMLNNYKIPLPPLDIQEEIVKECQKVDDEVEKANESIEKLKEDIETEISFVDENLNKLGNIALKITDSINPQENNGIVNYVGLENIQSSNGVLVGDIMTHYQDIKSSKTIFKKGDILYGKLRPNLNKVYLAKEDGICSTDILVFRFDNEYLAKFYKYYFLSKKFNDEVIKGVSGVQLPRTSWSKMESIKIPLPSLETQKQIVLKIEKLESKIDKAKKIVDSSKARKEEILRKYL